MRNTPTDRMPRAPFIPHVAADLSHSVDFQMLARINKAVSSILAAKTREIKFDIELTKADIRDLKAKRDAPPDDSNLTEEERDAKIRRILGVD